MDFMGGIPSYCCIFGLSNIERKGLKQKKLATDKKQQPVNIRNKKASFEYEFVEEFTAGIVLTGTEIKSVRQGKVSLAESYCIVHNGEVWVKKMHIAIYEQGSYNNHEPLRDRKLLLLGREIKKLENKLKDKGLTVVVKRIFISQRGLAKLDIALARGKKLYDKRQDIKAKDTKREIGRSLKL